MKIGIEQIGAIEYIRELSQGDSLNCCPELTVNFHPDRMAANGVGLLDVLGQDNILKSQFETGTSNGGLSAHTGGNRWLWEQHAFGGAYDNCSPQQRPKYGALNYSKLPKGASPRFGSSFFRFKSDALERTTFCFPDSFFKPVDFATYDNVGRLFDLFATSRLDLLDRYVEAHIHGPVVLSRDIESLVLDPSFKGTRVQQQAERLPLKVEWHSGFEIDVKVIEDNPDYRGGNCVRLAKYLARDGLLTPKILGDAVNASVGDAYELKMLWHYVARFGAAH